MTGSPFCVLGWEGPAFRSLGHMCWRVGAFRSLGRMRWVYMLTCSQKFLHFSKTAELFFKKSTFVPIFPYYAHKTLFKQELI